MDLSHESTYLAVYDGDCGLCARSIQFILQHDRGKRFRFSPILSPLGTAICESAGMSSADPSSFVAIVAGKRYIKSRAVLRVAMTFGGYWRILSVLLVIPPVVLDFLYDLVARHRKAIFPESRHCLVDPDFRSRMVVEHDAVDSFKRDGLL